MTTKTNFQGVLDTYDTYNTYDIKKKVKKRVIRKSTNYE